MTSLQEGVVYKHRGAVIMAEEQSESDLYVVGMNDNGTYYPVAHTATCRTGRLIGTRSVW